MHILVGILLRQFGVSTAKDTNAKTRGETQHLQFLLSIHCFQEVKKDYDLIFKHSTGICNFYQ